MCRTCPLLHRTDICGVVQRLPRRVSVPQAQVRFLPPLLMKFTAMKILTLIIKQKWFDAILSGEKTVETREVRPTNTKYISYRDNNTGKVYKKDSDVPESAWDSEKGVDTVINHYDAIQFWVGYEKNRPGALVEVKGVELVDMDDKTEREQNIFMNSPSAMGEFDMEKMRVLVPEIDYQAAGLSEADMNIYGITVMQEEINAGTSSIIDDFEEIQRPYEERKAAVKQMKEQIRQQSEQKVEDIESYVMINFKSYRAKSAFMLRFGFGPDDKVIPGEMFSDMVERVE